MYEILKNGPYFRLIKYHVKQTDIIGIICFKNGISKRKMKKSLSFPGCLTFSWHFSSKENVTTDMSTCDVIAMTKSGIDNGGKQKLLSLNLVVNYVYNIDQIKIYHK